MLQKFQYEIIDEYEFMEGLFGYPFHHIIIQSFDFRDLANRFIDLRNRDEFDWRQKHKYDENWFEKKVEEIGKLNFNQANSSDKSDENLFIESSESRNGNLFIEDPESKEDVFKNEAKLNVKEYVLVILDKELVDILKEVKEKYKILFNDFFLFGLINVLLKEFLIAIIEKDARFEKDEKKKLLDILESKKYPTFVVKRKSES